MSKCLICDGNRTVWEKDEFGTMKCQPCPACNKNGEAIRKEQDELDKLYRQIQSEKTAFEKRAVNG